MALLPPFFLDTVVAIGVGSDPAKRTWIGSGFIYGKLIAPATAHASNNYSLWLVTNKQVLTDLREIFIKLNSATEANSKDYRVSLIAKNGKSSWVGHPSPSTDVAAIFLNAGFLVEEKRRFAVPRLPG